jgi:hypothetical protein
MVLCARNTKRGMSDPEVIDRILQACSYRFRNVTCPNKDKIAKIAAAKLQADDADWTVIECSLMPPGDLWVSS